MKLNELVLDLKMGEPSKNQKAFMDEWYKMTKPHPFDDRHQRLLNNVGVALVPQRHATDKITLGIVISYEKKGEGQATQAMKTLLALADKYHQTLEGNIVPKKNAGAKNMRSMNFAQLRAWYKKLGFTVKNHDLIEYIPK